MGSVQHVVSFGEFKDDNSSINYVGKYIART